MMDHTLTDSSALSEIHSDITFKFPDADGVGDMEVAAHKMILAMVSKVFRNMFFIHDTVDKLATEIVMEDTTKPPFQIMLDAIYNVKPMKESLRGKSVDEMFAVLYLVSKYEIPKLLMAVQESLSAFPISEDNVLEVATDSMEYLTTFKEAAQILLLACAEFLKPKVSHSESFIRFVADNGDQMATVHKLAVLMKDMPPSPEAYKLPSPSNIDWCDGCQRMPNDCLDGQGVTGSAKVKVVEKSNSHAVGVVVRKDQSYDDYWFIRWENNLVKKELIYGLPEFLYKCS